MTIGVSEALVSDDTRLFEPSSNETFNSDGPFISSHLNPKTFDENNGCINMTKCYLLGAGASVGYTESKPMPLRPPRSKDFFLRGRDFGLLNERRFPNLYAKLTEYIDPNSSLNESPPDTLRIDVEEFLKHLANQDSSDSDLDININKSLGESIYFIYELLRYYQILYQPNNDNYSRLARHHFDEDYNVVSLNYDTLFESAIGNAGLNVNHGFTQNIFNTVPVAKLHGSINWLITFNGAIAGDTGDISGISHIVYSTNVTNSNITDLDYLPEQAVKSISCQDLVRSSANYSVPMLIPPVAGHKQYNQFDPYQAIQDYTKSLLSQADELVIIGCSLREEDELLLDILDEVLIKEIDVKIVARSSNEEVADKIRDIREDAGIDTSHREFTEYARTL